MWAKDTRLQLCCGLSFIEVRYHFRSINTDNINLFSTADNYILFITLDDSQTKLLDKYKHLWKDGKVDKNVIAQILKVNNFSYSCHSDPAALNL